MPFQWGTLPFLVTYVFLFTSVFLTFGDCTQKGTHKFNKLFWKSSFSDGPNNGNVSHDWRGSSTPPESVEIWHEMKTLESFIISFAWWMILESSNWFVYSTSFSWSSKTVLYKTSSAPCVIFLVLNQSWRAPEWGCSISLLSEATEITFELLVVGYFPYSWDHEDLVLRRWRVSMRLTLGN